MGGPRALGLLGQMGLLLLALASGPSSAEEDQGAPAHFLYQERAECHFAAAKAFSSSQGKGTGREDVDPPEMRFLQRVIYDRQEVMRFDSALGHYLALAPMAESNVNRLNKDQAQLQAMMDNVEACRHNYGVIQAFALRRRKPQSHSARSKKWTGVVGIVFGVVFVAAGLSVYLRNKKAGHAAPQTTVGLMD